MTSGRVLGLDPGEKRVGVALSDPSGLIAQPHAVLEWASDDVYAEVAALVRTAEVRTVVVGLPTSLSGEEGVAAKAARAFASDLEERLEVPVVFQDERFTTVQAEQMLLEGKVRRADRKHLRDKVAAAVMLQSFLNRQESDPNDVTT